MSKQSVTYGQNMLLHTSYWGDKDTFKLMPVTAECPFMEVIYDPSTTLLVVISKNSKDNFQFIPRLDDNGDNVKKKRTLKPGEKPYKEQRMLMTVLQEYYITDKDEQEAFIKAFAVNAESYDYKRFLRDIENEPLIHDVEKAPLVDEKGKPLVKKA